MHNDLKNIDAQLRLWIVREHQFLGRKWKAFHIEPIKKKKRRRASDDTSNRRVVMFATEGPGIDAISIGTMLNWFFPFGENMHQSLCKAFARLDLGLSRTIPTLTFEPSQIIYVDDITADGTPEDVRFDDSSIKTWPSKYSSREVMNDGCALISVGAALLIWQEVNKVTYCNEPMPSAFQGRIAGAKGIWMVSAEPSTIRSEKYDIWIQISASQRKFISHQEDRMNNPASDTHRLTFEYLKHSRSPVQSELHISFIPILIDRGVPCDVVTSLITEQLDAERKELLQILPTEQRLYNWIHQEGPNSTSEIPRWHAGMHKSLPDRIKHLIESGFNPKEEPFLADCIYRFIKQRQIWREAKFRVPLSKSTFVFGVADPLGVLEPGQVHMEFSTPFIDEATGSRFRSLDSIDALVSRQPACRRSDIQKVRAVKHPQLSHLVDVVVFPSRGRFPLAGKLQGGDYDGDIFWLCWDQALVEPFRNAPAPITSPDPAQYGIQQDMRELSSVMDPNDLSTVDDFLNEAMEFRMTPSLLGMVTSFAEKVAYMENRVDSKRLNMLYDMHDLLVDEAKNGYKLTDADYRVFTGKIVRGSQEPKEPAYKRAMKDCEDISDRKEKSDSDERRNAVYDYKKENVLDYLYFDVIRPHDVATLEEVENFYSKGSSDGPDHALAYPYRELRKKGGAEVQQELDALREKLKHVEAKWLNMVHDKERKSDWFNHAVDTCYSLYCSILPMQTDHPDVKPWICPYMRPEYSLWEEIRASIFYAEFTKKRHKLVWSVAGRQLAELKAKSYAGSTTVVPKIKSIMKPKAPKAPRPEEDESDEEFVNAMEDWSGSPVAPRQTNVVGVRR